MRGESARAVALSCFYWFLRPQAGGTLPGCAVPRGFLVRSLQKGAALGRRTRRPGGRTFRLMPPLPGTLAALLSLPGPAGDEAPIADWLAQTGVPQAAPDASVTRVLDNLIVVKGDAPPRVAVFAHVDTVGFTLGYGGELIAIGGPAPRDRDRLRATTPDPSGETLTGRLRASKTGRSYHLEAANGDPAPGTRWVYARKPRLAPDDDTLTAPYLDDRAGVWCALRVLARCPHVAVAFTTDEEQTGHGARVCADYLYRNHGLTQALIADLTWHTNDTPMGGGAVISLRDAVSPRQTFLDRVCALASESGIPHRREVQSAGSSDGGNIARTTVPMAWAFVGAAQKRPHTAREQVLLSDLDAMTDLLVYLIERI